MLDFTASQLVGHEQVNHVVPMLKIKIDGRTMEPVTVFRIIAVVSVSFPKIL
jgi:hypothetical protein